MDNPRLEIQLLEISGIRSAFEALRLPFRKECRTVSVFDSKISPTDSQVQKDDGFVLHYSMVAGTFIHEKDLALIKTLIKRGDEHAKCIRGIMYYLKITAPRWFWVEMDTYNVGVIPMGGTSTMHVDCKGLSGEELMDFKDKLPQGNLETRVRAFSLQTLQRIHKQRLNHRLPVWREFCKYVEELPLNELIVPEHE